MEDSSNMDTIPHIEETPMIFYEDMTTNSPHSSFLSSRFYRDLRESFKGEGFWVLGRGV